jgi:hypothetical protein
MHFLNLETLSKALRICLQITFAAGVVITALLWYLLRAWFGWYYWNNESYYVASVILLTPCGLCSLYILWQLIALLKTIDRKNPFARGNVRGLRRIAGSSFVISLLFLVLGIFHATVLTFGIAYIFLIAGFCFVILAGIFRKAVAFKDENDLTV